MAAGPDGLVRIAGPVLFSRYRGRPGLTAAEVAALLSACPAVREAVVTGRPDREWGERVTAVVLPADPARPPGLETLRDWVRRARPASAAPRELALVPEIPVLASGKPDLVALRGPVPGGPAGPGTIASRKR